ARVSGVIPGDQASDARSMLPGGEYTVGAASEVDPGDYLMARPESATEDLIIVVDPRVDHGDALPRAIDIELGSGRRSADDLVEIGRPVGVQIGAGSRLGGAGREELASFQAFETRPAAVAGDAARFTGPPHGQSLPDGRQAIGACRPALRW